MVVLSSSSRAPRRWEGSTRTSTTRRPSGPKGTTDAVVVPGTRPRRATAEGATPATPGPGVAATVPPALDRSDNGDPGLTHQSSPSKPLAMRKPRARSAFG